MEMRSGKEREAFDSFLKYFQENKISGNKMLEEFENVSRILQKCCSGKVDLLMDIKNEYLLKYINYDVDKMKSFNSYFQKRLQNLKKASNELSEYDEKMLRVDFNNFTAKYEGVEKIEAVNKLLLLLQRFNDTPDFNKVYLTKENLELKDEISTILKFVEKKRKSTIYLIEFYKKLLNDLKAKLAKSSIFAPLFNIKLDNFRQFLNLKKKLPLLTSEKNYANNEKFLTRNLPMIFTYTLVLKEDNTKCSLDDVVFLLNFKFEDNVIEIMMRIPSNKTQISFSFINKVVQGDFPQFADLAEFIFEETKGSENIMYFFNAYKYVKTLKDELKKTYPTFAIKLTFTEENSNSLGKKIKRFFDKNKDKIIVTNDKESLKCVFKEMKFMSFNLILNFDVKDEVSSVQSFEKIYKSYKEDEEVSLKMKY